MSDAMSLEAARRWEPYEGWQKGVALKWRYDDFKQGSIANRTMMLFPEISLSRSRSRGGLMPRWGDSQRYTVGYASRMWGSEIDALMVEAQYVLIRTYARDHRFVLRSHLGWIETSDFNDVPPDLRYFAGGDSKHSRLRLRVDLAPRMKRRASGRLAATHRQHRISAARHR